MILGVTKKADKKLENLPVSLVLFSFLYEYLYYVHTWH